MDEACAEGISDEHYRLEGRLFSPLLFISTIFYCFVPLSGEMNLSRV